MFFLTTSRPTPRPEISLTCGRGREAGREDQLVARAADRSIVLLADQAALDGRPRGSCSGSMPRPSSRDVEDDRVALLVRVERDAAHAPASPLRARSLGRLDAVIERVADDVHQRIGELLDHHLVELRVLAAQHELDLFVQLARDLAHGARELRVDLPDRHHAHLDDRLLQLVQLAVEIARDLRQLVRRASAPAAIVVRARERLELRLLDDQLADDVHHVIELARCRRAPSATASGATGRLRLRPRGSAEPALGDRLSRRRRLPQRADLRLGRDRRDRALVQRRAVQQPERDALAAAGVDARERRDDLPCLAQLRRQRRAASRRSRRSRTSPRRRGCLAGRTFSTRRCSSYSVSDFFVCSSSVSSENGSRDLLLRLSGDDVVDAAA